MTCSWSKVVPFTVPLLVVVVLLAGCSKPTLETIDIEPSSVTITVGQTQQLQATGRDTKGEVMEGITFAWSVQGEGGRIDATNGLFTARQLGTVSVIAAAEAENVRGTATITVKREPVASLAAQMPKHVVAGSRAQFSVMAKNAAGQGLADVRVQARALSEGTTLDQTAATTDASGQARFTVTTPTQVQEIRLQLSADEQQTTATMQTEPGPVAAFRLTPDPETVVAGGKVQLHVAVQDQGANPVPNAPVRFTALSPGTAVDPVEAVTDTQGQVSAEVQTRRSAGVNKVQVRVADLDTQDVEIQGDVGPPARLQLRADTTATVAGGTVHLTVQVQDAHDNAVANTAVRLTVSPTDAELEAATLTSDRNGRAATALRLSQTAGAHTIEAAVANLPVTSLSIMAQAPTALRLTPQTITVDMLGTQQFRAVAVDADGNAIAVSPAWKVMGDNGTTDARGVFSATGLGDELLVATYADFTVGAHITVVPGEATSVEVTPAEATITAATNQQFHVAVFNAHRYPLDLAPSWEVTNDLGTIDSAGLLTALRAGTGEVVATVAGVTGRVNVTVAPGVLATLKVAPDQLEMRAGEEKTLQATGFDAVGNEVPIKPTWSLTADLGELDASGTLRALHVGSGKIQVAAGPVPIVVAIPIEVVAADLERLEVSPRTLTLSAGDEHAFAVTGYDAYENIVDVTPEWSLSHRVGDIDAQGLFLARRTGSAQVHATVGAHRGEASVTVKPNDLASLIVQPVGPLTLTAGSTVSLTITGYDAHGNTVVVTPIWSQTAPLGRLKDEGLFRAEKVGSGAIVAQSGEHVVTVDVTVVAGKLSRLALSPTAETLRAGKVVTVSAAGFDAYDNEVLIRPTWRVSRSIGEVSATGEFRAMQARIGEVIATAEGISAAVEVTVEPGTLTFLSVSPEQLSLTAGETAELIVVGYDAYGNPVSTQPTWHIPEGMGSIAGDKFTAQKAGTGRLIVAVEHLAAMIDLSVEPGEVASLVVTPTTAQVASGTQHPFTVQGFDPGGNAVPVAATWEVEGDGGTVTPEGVFTARRAGASRIQARVGALTAQAEVVVVPGVATRLQVAPVPTFLKSGDDLTLQSEAFDAAGNTVQTPPRWTVVGDVGTVSEAGVFTATEAGTGAIVASLGEATQRLAIDVRPGPLAAIGVTPEALIVSAGGVQSFTALGYDAYGNPFPIEPTWSLQGSVGQIDASSGVFQATTVGSGTVVAVVNTIAGLAAVTVKAGRVSQLRMTPSHTSVAAGEYIPFSVTAFDAFNNVTTADLTWGLSAALGQLTPGKFQGTRVGNTEVIVRSGDIETRAAIDIQPGPVTRLQLTPPQVELVAGKTLQLRASGFDAYNNAADVTVTWELSGGVGTLTPTGALTAGKQGTGQITAHFQGLTHAIPVQVMPGPLQQLRISPARAQVASSRSQDFAVIGLDAGGNELSVPVKWALSSGLGTLSNTGTFTAAHTGTGALVAYTQTVLGMIEVTVQPGPAALVFIAPQSVTAPAGGQVEFQVRAFDVNQNPLPALPARWSVIGNIGHIDPDTGGFTATHMGQGKVQAEIAGQVGSVDVQVRHGAPDADKSRLVATRLTVPADGKTATDIIVRVQDRFGNPITDAQVTLISTRADQIDQPVPTDQHGVALGHIRSVDPGRSEIRAVIGSVRISNPLNLTFTRHGVSG